MKKLLTLTVYLISLTFIAQENFSIPTINSFNYKEINKSGEKNLYVFLSFNECETCYKITDEKLKIINNKNLSSGLNQFINPHSTSTETLKVFELNNNFFRKPLNLIYSYKVNDIEKTFNFPIYEVTPKIDDTTKLLVGLKDAKIYDSEYLELKISISDFKNTAIEGIEINKLGLLFKGFKIIKENYQDVDKKTDYIVRVTDKVVLEKIKGNNSVSIKIKPFGFVLSNESNDTDLEKGNSLKIEKIELKNTLTKEGNYVEYLNDIFEVNNGNNEIKITTNSNTSIPSIKLIDIREGNEITGFKLEKMESAQGNVFVYRFKLGECCIGSATYKLIVELKDDNVFRNEEIIIKKEVKNYVSKLTYDNRFDRIILTVNTINAIDEGVEPKISLNDPDFNSTFGLDNDVKSLTEFRFKSIKFADPKLKESTSNIIYFDIDKDLESDFSFKFYFISQEKIKEAVKKAIVTTDKSFENKNSRKKIKIIDEIKSDGLPEFAENLEASLKEYIGNDPNAIKILADMNIDPEQAITILDSVVFELDNAANKSDFFNTGFGKVITSVVAVLPKVLPIILAL